MDADPGRAWDYFRRRLGFDPHWSADEALQHAIRQEQRRSVHGYTLCPFQRWFAGIEIESCYRQYESGWKEGLLLAVAICGDYGFAVPVWASMHFNRSYSNWSREQVRTLDEAFRVTRKKWHRLKHRYSKRHWQSIVLYAVEDLYRNNVPIGPALFEEVGKKLNTSGSTVRDTYYEARKRFRNN
jgi:hypothetical protein